MSWRCDECNEGDDENGMCGCDRDLLKVEELENRVRELESQLAQSIGKWDLAPRAATYECVADDGQHDWRFEALSIGRNGIQKLIVPLDYNTREEAQSIVAQLNGMETLRQENAELLGFVDSMLTLHGCGCESVSEGGWTCPAHKLLRLRSHRAAGRNGE